jgi:ribosomal protein S7
MAQAKDVARTEVQATVNKEMIDGAKKAAADAVKEQLPAIAKEVARETAKAMVEAQKESTPK